MRRPLDRVRHALSFEIIGLMIVTPLGSWAFGRPMFDIGVVSVVGATVATLFNYVYNLGFDHVMLWWRRNVRKTLLIRVLHAILFEAGLLVVLLPVFTWFLDIGIWQALMMEISFALFYLVYAFVFNWVYDVVFPIPER